MLIIFGKFHFSKENISTRSGRCPKCEKTGALLSFEGIKVFHLYWIPLIPYGKYRVVDECPNCGYSGDILFPKWEKMVAKFKTAKAEQQNFFIDLTEAVRFHGDTILFEGQEAGIEVADALLEHFGGEAEALRYLGNWFRQAGLHDKADQVLDDLARLDPDDAQNYLKQANQAFREGRSLEAARFYQMCMVPAGIESRNNMFRLAYNLDKFAEPAETFRYMTHLVRQYPEMVKVNDIFKSKYRKLEKQFSIQDSLLDVF
ncbi:MAG: hypothetical protein H6581_12470 [Bacteroidia bacterium]|nr:hypothetical protein [Bacteroidia bacterium]